MSVGGKCLKYLKRGWKRKEGRGDKDFKEVEQGGGGVAGTPFRTMIHIITPGSSYREISKFVI